MFLHILLVPLGLTLINFTHFSSVFIVGFQQISHIVVMSLLLSHVASFVVDLNIFQEFLFRFIFDNTEKTFSHLFLVFIFLYSLMLPLM